MRSVTRENPKPDRIARPWCSTSMQICSDQNNILLDSPRPPHGMMPCSGQSSPNTSKKGPPAGTAPAARFPPSLPPVPGDARPGRENTSDLLH